MAFVLHVPETPEDAGSQEPSPYDEAEVHNSFHQLIQEQSQWVAAAGPESGLELREREPEARTPGAPDGGHQAVPGPEGAPVYSAATLRILANMPSRTIGRSRGAIISQYYNRTVQLRRRGSRPLLSTARPSLRLRDLELDPKALQEEEKRSLLVRELQGLTGAQRDHMLRRMPLSLAEKRCLREESQTLRRKQRGRQGRDGVWSCCSRLKYGCVLGYFTHTVMYYGYYSNTTLNQQCAPRLDGNQCTPGEGGLPYNMPLAYLFTMGVAFFITCITLVYSMSRSFGESYRVGSTSGIHAITVFCSWDYKVTQRWASRLQQDNLRTQLKELLAEWQLRRVPRSVCGQLQRVAVLGFVWLLCLGTTMGCAMAVYSFSEFILRRQVDAGQEVALLALPVVVSLINLVVPYMYRGLAALEQHESPVLEVYMAICRNLILKMVILGILCYHWLGRRVGALRGQCWEDFVGQELYRFMVMDFIFILVDTLFGELVWRLVSEKKLKRWQKPEFDIARNVLELIYGQTLTWLGVLFSPLLPAIQVLKLLLLFYIKKTSLMANCQAPRRPWLASHMSTVFITLLCFPSFLGAAIFLCYAIWQVKPSSICGPFQTLDTMYQAGKVWVHRLEHGGPRVSWLPWVHHYLLENTSFIFLVSALLLAVIYLNIQVVKGQRKVICLLKEQISNEGEDKVFLINKLHSVYERKEKSRCGATPCGPCPAPRRTGGPVGRCLWPLTLPRHLLSPWCCQVQMLSRSSQGAGPLNDSQRHPHKLQPGWPEVGDSGPPRGPSPCWDFYSD
ncbi:transmembrane channel-like protein 6 isoform X4 [Elephas maximus indicus]|uniref:transmembrane channel-like protein 6 isoform X4 n=1 Tax=Elephas maximus indicus TaxID=99487 RepID=UPI0021171F3C|nr:transmembrane channel-like protein 6 isoform X4 [Elephas maximus indicus]